MHYLRQLPALFSVLAIILACAGCSLFPDVRHRPRFHNPFPQLKRVAVLPFYNQSDEPTLDVDQATAAYYAELQAIPGFEVLPTNVVANQWRGYLQYVLKQPDQGLNGAMFQAFARDLGVDAVVVGAITDYTPYYPPRLALTVHWYAANPGFHPIPPGYGLPWGTRGEDKISRWAVQESEAELARQQLATQSPVVPSPNPALTTKPTANDSQVEAVQGTGEVCAEGMMQPVDSNMMPLPGWPDPSGLIPPSPQAIRPNFVPQSEPVLSHTRIYHGTDLDVTERLATYFDIRDDARFGGWQSYLTRSEDFVRFCCHMHITDMLEVRGGRDESDLILRWPLNRYSR